MRLYRAREYVLHKNYKLWLTQSADLVDEVGNPNHLPKMDIAAKCGLIVWWM